MRQRSKCACPNLVVWSELAEMSGTGPYSNLDAFALRGRFTGDRECWESGQIVVISVGLNQHDNPLTPFDCTMATWTKFYVNTADVQGLTARLKSLSGIATATYSSFPKDHYASYLIGDPLPSYMVFTATQPRWVTVVYNSAHKLPDWCKQLSSEFKTKVIVTMAQSVSMYYYFALYENGELKRELEYCYSEDFEPVNYGEPLACEQSATLKIVQTEEDDDDNFDFEAIEKYCDHFGLTIQRDYHEYEWTVIKGKSTAKTTGQYLKSLQKPWWKFW